MTLEEIGEQLGAAVDAADFERATELAKQYRSRFDEIWTAMPAFERQASDLPERALRLHQQVVARMVRVRVAKAAELRTIQRAQPYGPKKTATQKWGMTL
jgi:propanediol dehydratase small subunit